MTVAVGRPPSSRLLSPADALAHVAVSVKDTLELDSVLPHVVRVTRELVDADRATLLLLDTDGRLNPAVAVARKNDVELWTRFRAMPPIRLDLTPQGWELLRAGGVTVVDDAAQSPLIPAAWHQAFGLVSLAIAPMLVHGEPVGTLVVDHVRPHRFSDDELRALEGIAASTAHAVRNARDFVVANDRAADLERALAVATALNAASGLDAVARTAADAFAEILGADGCAICVIEHDSTVRVLNAQGGASVLPSWFAVPEVPDDVRRLASRAWSLTPPEPVVLRGSEIPRGTWPFAGDADSGAIVGVPLLGEDGVQGFVVARCPGSTGPSAERLRRVMALAAPVWLAVERARLVVDLDHHRRQQEVLRRVGDDLTLAPNLQLAIERIAPTVRMVVGAEPVDVVLSDRRAARMFGTAPMPRDVAAQARRWRRETAPRPVSRDGLTLVPMLVDSEVVGVLRVRVPDAHSDDDFLLSVASSLGDAVTRAVLHLRVTETERHLAVAAERERLARDLHQTLGRLLLLAAQQLAPAAAAMRDADVRANLREVTTLLAHARAELKQTVQTLSALEGAAGELPARLRRVGQSLAATTGADVRVQVRGRARRLPPQQEALSIAVLRESVSLLTAEAHATWVVATVSYAADTLSLHVRDNGVDAAQRGATPWHDRMQWRRLVKEAAATGGRLRVVPVEPTGLSVELTLPTS